MNYRNEKLDILIQGGQSNAEGFGLGPVECEYVPCEEILYLVDSRSAKVLPKGIGWSGEKSFNIEKANNHPGFEGLCGDFSLAFAQKYIQSGRLGEGRKLLIIRAAVGGTGFVTSQWGLQDDLYVRMMEMVNFARSLNAENRVVGFLWHQGETDAIEGNTPDAYYKQLMDMLRDIRAYYGNIPFVAADFVHEWKNHNLHIAEPIVEVIRRVTETADNPPLAK